MIRSAYERLSLVATQSTEWGTEQGTERGTKEAQRGHREGHGARLGVAAATQQTFIEHLVHTRHMTERQDTITHLISTTIPSSR